MMPFSLTSASCERLDMAIIPDPSSQELTIFTSHKCRYKDCPGKDNTPFSIHYTRYTFEGRFVKESTSELPGLTGAELIKFRPVDRRGGYALEFYPQTTTRGNTLSSAAGGEPRLLLFDGVMNTPTQPMNNISLWGGSVEFVWWNDISYQALPVRNFVLREPTDRSTLLMLIGTRYVWSRDYI
jgi:hypothetical protein